MKTFDELKAEARAVVGRGFEEELFDLCRNDDYVGIYAVIAERIQDKAGA